MTLVLPVAGRAVYLPNTRPPLPVPAEGVDVVLDAFWLRRLRDGDVRLATTGVPSGTTTGAQTGGSTSGGSGGTTSGVPTGTTTAVVDQTARTAAAAAKATADGAIPATQKGVAGGVATLGQDGRVPAAQLPPSSGAQGSAEEGVAPGDLPSAANASTLVGVASDGSLVRVPPTADGVAPDDLPSVNTAPELVGVDLDGGLVRLITPSLAGPLASLPIASTLGDADQVPVYQGGTWKRIAGSIVKAAGGSGGGTTVSAPATAPALSFVSATASGVSPVGITLRLGAVSGAAGHKLEMKKSADATWQTVSPERAPGDVVLSPLIAGTSYDFRATAYNGAGDGPTSAVLTRSTSSSGTNASPAPNPANEAADALDGYASTWLALHSVARRLRSAYTGPLCRVRRFSDGTEQDFGTTAAGLLDTAAVLAFAGSGDACVVKLYDHTGLGRHADLYEMNGGAGPLLVQAGALVTGPGSAGRPAMRFRADLRHVLKTAALPALSNKLMLAASVLTTDTDDNYRPFVCFEPVEGSPAGSDGFLGSFDGRVLGAHASVQVPVGAVGSGANVPLVASAEWNGTTAETFANAIAAAGNGSAANQSFGAAGGTLSIGNIAGPFPWTGMGGVVSEAMAAAVPVAGERANLVANMRAFMGIA